MAHLTNWTDQRAIPMSPSFLLLLRPCPRSLVPSKPACRPRRYRSPWMDKGLALDTPGNSIHFPSPRSTSPSLLPPQQGAIVAIASTPAWPPLPSRRPRPVQEYQRPLLRHVRPWIGADEPPRLGLDTSRAEPSLIRAWLWLALERLGSARLAQPTSLLQPARLALAMARLRPSRLVSQFLPEPFNSTDLCI